MQDKLRKILKYYGEEVQAKKYIEELSELMIAIIKGDIKNIKEEIADVRVMTKQVLMFKCVDIKDYKCWKEYVYKKMEYLKDAEIEKKLQSEILDIQQGMLTVKITCVVDCVAVLEYLLDRYMDINNISKEEIEKEMERKINRQLERMEREKVNK
ncbi:hypothetical protein QJR26_08905 [Clostridium baratii]